ncbi:MAG: hypothetical protein ABGZ17_24845, partial [Planctomycetaceae bacterium]
SQDRCPLTHSSPDGMDSQRNIASPVHDRRVGPLPAAAADECVAGLDCAPVSARQYVTPMHCRFDVR